MNQPYSQPDKRDPTGEPDIHYLDAAREAALRGQIEEPAAFPTRPEFFIPIAKPTWTHILIGCNLVVFVAMLVYGYVMYQDWQGSTNNEVLTDFGMKVNFLVAHGQVWRLFTAMFLHIGVIHLLFNLYALNALGPMTEGFFGHKRFLAIYLLGGLFGSLASYAFSPAASAGASGAVFALVGATTVYFLRYHQNFGTRGRAILQNMAVVIVINLIFGYSMPGIDNWGHIGGLFGGALTAWGVLPRYRTPAVVRLGRQPLEEDANVGRDALWIIVCVALFAAGLFFATRYHLASFGQ